MRRAVVLICVSVLGYAYSQDQNADNFMDLFTTPDTGFFKNYDVVTKNPDRSGGDIPYIEKCGEGKDKGLHMCVPYDNCDGETKTIISKTDFDGAGVIDIRAGATSCQHYLDVCCGLPDNGVLPPEITDPKEPTIPVTAGPLPPVDTPAYCGIRNENGIDFQVTGDNNNETEFGEFPWMLAILHKDYNPSGNEPLAICGASLIAPDVVLTGAHCVFKIKTDEIKVRAGEWDTQTEKERYAYQERNVVQIIPHENFASGNLYNDIALLVLEKPFKRAPHIGTVCLPQQGQKINSRTCFVNGWGKNIFGQKGRYQAIMKKIQLPTIPREQCQSALRNTRLGDRFKLHESFICAGGENGRDACTGDGGSPLTCPDPANPKRYIQIGIVAWGIGCGDPVPGVYADVAKFRSWIDQNVARLNVDSSSYIQ